MNIGDRIVRLLKSNIGDTFDSIAEIVDYSGSFLEEKLSEWERSSGIGSNDDAFNGRSEFRGTGSSTHADEKTVDQFTEDLGLFGLIPPSSWDEVKQARNREIKKFHPDKYAGEPEKQDVAKQIMQIYNSAYDRLKKRFQE